MIYLAKPTSWGTFVLNHGFKLQLFELHGNTTEIFFSVCLKENVSIQALRGRIKQQVKKTSKAYENFTQTKSLFFLFAFEFGNNNIQNKKIMYPNIVRGLFLLETSLISISFFNVCGSNR